MAADYPAVGTHGNTANGLIYTIGGVSKGTHDLVHTTLQELGVETVFHGIAMKPGKPKKRSPLKPKRGNSKQKMCGMWHLQAPGNSSGMRWL